VKNYQTKEVEPKLSLYDTKVIHCYRCDKDIGEVDWEAVVIAPKCGDCANPYPKNDDLLPRTVRKVTKTKNKEQPIAENMIICRKVK